MVLLINANKYISQDKRKHKYTFNLETIKNGVNSVRDENGTILLETTLKDGVKHGVTSLLLRGYYKTMNVVDVMEFDNDRLISSTIYIIERADINEKVELIRKTEFNGKKIILDEFYKNGDISESFKYSNDKEIHLLYKKGYLTSASVLEGNYVTYAHGKGGDVYDIVKFDQDNLIYEKKFNLNGDHNELNMNLGFSFKSYFLETNSGTKLHKKVNFFNNFTCEFEDASENYNFVFNKNEKYYNEKINIKVINDTPILTTYSFNNDKHKITISDNNIVISTIDDNQTFELERNIPFFKMIKYLFKGIDIFLFKNVIDNHSKIITKFSDKINDSLKMVKSIDKGEYSLNIKHLLNE